jgi:hypothetical protein
MLALAIGVAIVATVPAQAFTPPIGSNKGSAVGPQPTGYYDMSSPYLK